MGIKGEEWLDRKKPSPLLGRAVLRGRHLLARSQPASLGKEEEKAEEQRALVHVDGEILRITEWKSSYCVCMEMRCR